MLEKMMDRNVMDEGGIIVDGGIVLVQSAIILPVSM